MQLPLKGAYAMSGDRYLLDTNAIIALLQGDDLLLKHLQNARWIGISVISQIEFLVFSGLSDRDRQVFDQFIQRIDVIELSPKQDELIGMVVKLRQQYHVKLPDAIIAATAMQYGADLITADRQLHNIQELEVVDFTQI